MVGAFVSYCGRGCLGRSISGPVFPVSSADAEEDLCCPGAGDDVARAGGDVFDVPALSSISYVLCFFYRVVGAARARGYFAWVTFFFLLFKKVFWPEGVETGGGD